MNKGMTAGQPEDHDDRMGQYARTLLQVEMKKRQMTYRDLTEKLKVNSPGENERNVRNKVARGTFSAAFFVDCLLSMGCRTLELGQRHPNNPKLFGLYLEEPDPAE